MATINRTYIKPKTKKEPKPSAKEYSKYYSNPLWRSNRDWYLTKHPLCECCASQNRITASELVHHMIPFSRGIDEKHKQMLLINPDNFMACCKACHRALHKKDSIHHQDVLNYLTPQEYDDAHNLRWLK